MIQIIVESRQGTKEVPGGFKERIWEREILSSLTGLGIFRGAVSQR
ncbi:MAG: hypothetical protein WAO00_03940 [Chthoniobacterales bacterium]